MKDISGCGWSFLVSLGFFVKMKRNTNRTKKRLQILPDS